MHNSEFTFMAYNTKIYGRSIAPLIVNGVVVLVHGFGEHSGRYLGNVVPVLNDLGLAVIVTIISGTENQAVNEGTAQITSHCLIFWIRWSIKPSLSFPKCLCFFMGIVWVVI